jgi:hypothetical protein
MCVPPPSDNKDDGGDDSAEAAGVYPPPENDVVAGAVPYPVDDSVPYPVDNSVPYQVDDSVPYPVDDSVPYPTDTSYPIDVAYPVDVSYPDETHGYPDTDEAYGGQDIIPAVAPYPGLEMDSDVQQSHTEKPTAKPSTETKKKKFDGDKVVVGFVPSTVKRKVGKSKSKKDSN